MWSRGVGRSSRLHFPPAKAKSLNTKQLQQTQFSNPPSRIPPRLFWIIAFIDIVAAQQAEAEAFQSQSHPQSSPTTAFTMDKFKAFTNSVSSTVTPFANRSSQWFREQTGNAGEKTELPHDYIELETRIDALKQTHQKLLAATSQYANEAYDYPPNIRESFQDLGRSISDKVRLERSLVRWHC